MNKMEEDTGMEGVCHGIHVAQGRSEDRIMVGKRQGWWMEIKSFCKGGS